MAARTCGAQDIDALGVTQSRIVRLSQHVDAHRRVGFEGLHAVAVVVAQIRGHRIHRRFAAVPHHGADEARVGGQQRAAIKRQLDRLASGNARVLGRIGSGVGIGVQDHPDVEVTIARHRYRNADQALGADQAIGRAALGERADARQGSVGSVVQTEERVETLRGVEQRLDLYRSDGHRRGGLVTSDTAPSVDAEILKEGIIFVRSCSVHGDRAVLAGRIRKYIADQLLFGAGFDATRVVGGFHRAADHCERR